MRICIVAVGSRGDIQPCIALGDGLKAAGHTVRIVTHTLYEHTIINRGLAFAPLHGNPMEEMEKFSTVKGNPIRLIREQRRVMRSLLGSLFRDAWEGVQDAELVIATSLMMYFGHTVTEKLHIPSIGNSLQPTIRTHALPSPFLPWRTSLGSMYNLWTHDLVGGVIWLEARHSVNALRQTLDLPPLPLLGMYKRLIRQNYPFLCAYSPLISARPGDWSSNISVTGSWFLEPSTDWQPSPELLAFLDAGSPPIYIGFGSTTITNSQHTTEQILKALEMTQQRGIILPGWKGLHADNLPAHVFAIDDVPFDWLFPKMAALVHHGGAGTTAYGFRSGIPSIIVPFMLDHFFWSERAFLLGVSPCPIRPKQLTAEVLAEAITTALQDQVMRTRANDLGRALQQEQGVTQAVKMIEELFATKQMIYL